MLRIAAVILCCGMFIQCGINRSVKSPAPAKYPKFSQKDSLLGFLNRDRSCYDVTYYDMNLTIDPDKKRVSGFVNINFDAVLDIERMQIDLDQRLEIHSITDSNGDTLRFTRKYRAVKVELNQKIKAGGSSMIRVHYSGKPQVAKNPPWKGGLVWKKKKGMHFCGVACEDDGSSIWWPGKDHISDKPDSIEVTYTIPKGHFCVGNGRLIQHQKTFDGKEKFTWRTSYPINPYNVTFYIGDYKHFTLPYEHEGSQLRQLDFYVLPEHLKVAKYHFQQAVDQLKLYEDLFGYYPWWKDGYKLVESPYEGMEHQTAIAYGEDFENEKFTSYDYIILHETAHEWWGNYLTVCDMSDLWLHEGFATYAEMLYEERTEGKSMYELSYDINKSSSINKRPLVGPRDVAYTNFRDDDIYTKGAVVLAMLRKYVDDDNTFFDILKKFMASAKRSCVMTEDFIRLVNKETHDDWQWFFDQFVFRAEAPELEYNYVLVGEESQFRYRWNSKNTNANFRLPVTAHFGEIEKKVVPTTELQILVLPKNASPSINVEQDDFVIYTFNKRL